MNDYENKKIGWQPDVQLYGDVETNFGYDHDNESSQIY